MKRSILTAALLSAALATGAGTAFAAPQDFPQDGKGPQRPGGERPGAVRPAPGDMPPI